MPLTSDFIRINVFKIPGRRVATHCVFNQGLPLTNFNLYKSDPHLISFTNNFADPLASQVLNTHGVRCGTEGLMNTARIAEKSKPELSQFDIYGRRVDVVDYHDAYHQLMSTGLEAGVSGYGFSLSAKGSHVTRAGLLYMQNQVEPGHCCPLVMTTAAILPLKKYGYDDLVSKLSTFQYDHRNIPIDEKVAITAGMSMTEKQGGSDVRANTTTAQPEDPSKRGNGNAYRLVGHKWFTSAPMCDIFLTLAHTEGHKTPSCFIVYRWIPNGGGRNTGFKVMRLKNKVGDRANASSEVEYEGAFGTMLGDEGNGVKTIIDMVQSTRLDCILGSAGGCRRSLQHVLMHAKHRQSFGLPLIDHPLMKNVVADLCLEAEAQTLTALYFSAVFDAASLNYALPTHAPGGYANGTSNEADMMKLFRIGVAVGKYWVTKRHPGFVYECMEAFGGNGFVEDFPMAMLFRQSPLNSIWEGSGNIIALDILRAKSSFPILLHDIKLACGVNSEFDSFVTNLERSVLTFECLSPADAQRSARFLADHMALALQGSIMLRYTDARVATAFVSARLSRDRLSAGDNYGSFLYDADLASFLIERNMPQFD